MEEEGQSCDALLCPTQRLQLCETLALYGPSKEGSLPLLTCLSHSLPPSLPSPFFLGALHAFALPLFFRGTSSCTYKVNVSSLKLERCIALFFLKKWYEISWIDRCVWNPPSSWDWVGGFGTSLPAMM